MVRTMNHEWRHALPVMGRHIISPVGGYAYVHCFKWFPNAEPCRGPEPFAKLPGESSPDFNTSRVWETWRGTATSTETYDSITFDLEDLYNAIDQLEKT
jgi:hypothetical protein